MLEQITKREKELMILPPRFLGLWKKNTKMLEPLG